MGPLKDELFYQVWLHLQATPHYSTMLPSLTSPKFGSQGVRNAWTALQSDAGRAEGMTKKKGLQVVLSERPDIFVFRTNEKSHLLIELTEVARRTPAQRGLSFQGDGTPVLQPTPSPLLPAVEAAAQATEARLAAGAAIRDGSPEAKRQKLDLSALGLQPIAVFPKAAPAPEAPSTMEQQLEKVQQEIRELEASMALTQQSLASQGLTGMAVSSGSTMQPSLVLPAQAPLGKHGQYQDLVWTPVLAAIRQRDGKKDYDMKVAMFHAMEVHYGGSAVTLSQLGSDFSVAQLKKDMLFKNLKLVDIIKRYPDTFELIPDPTGGGYLVRMHPGASANMPPPDRTASLTLPGEASPRGDVRLPARLDNPVSTRDRMQALRIELVHALARRGNRSPVQDLGQEPRVQKLKQNLTQAKKLLDFLKLFPGNFLIQPEGLSLQSTTYVDLISTDVSDQEAIDLYVLRMHQAQLGFGRAGDAKGRGKGKLFVDGRAGGLGGRGRSGLSAFTALYGSDPMVAAQIAAAQAQAQLQMAQSMAIAGLSGIGSTSSPHSQVGFSPPIL